MRCGYTDTDAEDGGEFRDHGFLYETRRDSELGFLGDQNSQLDSPEDKVSDRLSVRPV
jgi:hypothetical protein